MIASCDSAGSVIIWDVRRTAPMKTVDCGPLSANMVAFDPPGTRRCIISLCISSEQCFDAVI